MKKISVVIPAYNERECIGDLCAEIINIFESELPTYNFEIIIADNCSTDGTRETLRTLCSNDKHIKAILNTRNFGPDKSAFNGLKSACGDAVVFIVADFQVPPSLIPSWVHEWEKGAKAVCAIKKKSKTNRVVHMLRGFYYKMMRAMSEIEQIEQFDGMGLFDRSIIETMRKVDDPAPYIRGIVSEYAYRRVEVEYVQQKRKVGKTKFNFYKYYDFAMVGLTSYTKTGLRLAVLVGFIVSFSSFVFGTIYFILKLINWDSYPGATVPTLLGVFFLGGVQIFFTGFLGEYILSISSRIVKKPSVVEEERLNFDE